MTSADHGPTLYQDKNRTLRANALAGDSTPPPQDWISGSDDSGLYA